MRRYLVCILAFATVVFSASTCEKMEPGDYHDYLGNKINLLGPWVLSEVQVKTAGVIETHRCNPESVMEFASKGQGYTKDMAGDVLDTWHYETYRAAVTIRDEMQTTTVIGEPVEPAADPEPEPETEQEPEILWPPRVLCAGMSGADVTALQGLLLAHGYDCKTTSGAFDARTKAMVLAFQGENGLDTDGIAGPLTWGKLLARG